LCNALLSGFWESKKAVKVFPPRPLKTEKAAGFFCLRLFAVFIDKSSSAHLRQTYGVKIKVKIKKSACDEICH